MRRAAEDLNRSMESEEKHSFLAGGGELGALIREHDWTTTPLGPPEQWPQSLKTAVRIMLTSRQPIWIGWGEELLYLYNDPYKSIVGGKHPWALGQPVRMVWQEIWQDIGSMLATAMKGDEGTYVEEQLLIMERNGYPEETYYTFSYSPIPTDDGGAGGIICANTDDTERVIGERQITLLKEVAARTVDARTAKEACERSAQALATNSRDLPFALIYLADQSSSGFGLWGSVGITPGHPAAPQRVDDGDSSPWPLTQALRAHEPQVVDDLSSRLDVALPGGDWDIPALRQAVFPISASGDTGRQGLLVVGLNPFRLFDEGYRGFLSLVARQIGTAVANAEAYEDERRRAEALAEIDKAKTTFFSNVSHEFRTPLTLMLGPLEDAIDESESLPAEQRERLEVAHRNSLRLLKLVNSLLDFSRIEAGRVRAAYRPTDLGPLTAELASSFRAATDRAGLQLIVETSKPIPAVFVDREMWEKIVLNLLSNAFKFTFDGEIAVRLVEENNRARLTVRDTGIGIPANELPKLFERFHRVEGARGRSYEGSGIGLALVNELVKQHGGEIRVESEVGRGTCFTIEIPFGSAHLPPDQVSAAADEVGGDLRTRSFVEEALRWLPDGAAQSGEQDAEFVKDVASDRDVRTVAPRKRVVLADDNADLRDYIGRLLRERGFAVESVGDGYAALAAIRAARPDLLITDVMMPRLDGLGLLNAIRGDPGLRDLSVIMLSARSGEEARVEGLDAGADDYLIKPFSARELIARVDSHLAMARLRRESTEALRQSEARFRALANASSDVVYCMSADWTQMRQLDGRGFIADTNEATTDWIQEYLFPEDRDQVLAVIDDAIRCKKVFELEHRVRRADGSVGWTFSRAIPILDENGELMEWFGMAADVTERRRTEGALRESEARFRNMADHAPVMMWVTDAEGQCIYLNRLWYEFTGQHEGEGLGFGWLDAVHPDDRESSGESFRAANAKRETFRAEYRLRSRDGTYRWAIDAASPRFAPDGEFLGYIGSVLDIDDRKRQEGLRVLQNSLLELAIQDMPLNRTLEELLLAIESQSSSDMLASILLVDQEGLRLRHCAAPSLPREYVEAIDGVAIGPNVGSCGTAAHSQEPVFVSDIATDPLWADFRDLALEHGLHACWSSPIFSGRGEVLGTFAVYYRAPRTPAPSDVEIVEFVTHTASLVLERKTAQDALRDETRLLETLNRTGAALAGELDLQRVVQMVTDAGVELIGAAFGAFFYNVVNESNESYMLYTLSGVDRSAFERFPMPRNTAVFAPTFDGTEIVRSDDILLDARYGKNAPYRGMPEGHLPVRSYLAVPVISRTGEVIGGLFFGHSSPGRFSERHERLMVGIAGQAAVAIDNARLYQAAQTEIRQRAQAELALQQLNDQLETRVAEEIGVRHQAEAALQQAHRMEAIGQLTGGVAHDFNNLLQVISGNLHLLSKDVAGNERAEQRVQNALSGVSRGAKLASQLLAFGRRQPLEPKVINVGRFVRALDDMLRRALGEEIEIETTVAGGLWNTFVDPSQVENAILNLAINARDAMNGRGRLTVEVGNAFLDSDYACAHPDVKPGQYVMLAVTDTGSGMSREVIDKAFEPFFSTKAEGQGTGLGLSMVYGFAKQSGGHAKIYSELGHGTTVKLYLPRVHQSEDVVVERDERPIVRGSETILVVEDDEEVRATAVEMLTDLGYRVLKAADAASALAIVESGVAIDVLFSDVVMPGPLRSPELARKAQERLPGIAVLFTSGYTENAIVHGGRLDEGVNLLPKPYTREALARKIRHVLDQKSHTNSKPSAASASARREPAPKAPPPARPLAVLLVEDEELIRINSADMLRELGHTVIEAGSGEEALTVIRSSKVDVLITDVELPGISGVELADKTRELNPAIGVVFATGKDNLPDRERHSDRCAVLLQKPYDAGGLAQCLGRFDPAGGAPTSESEEPDSTAN